MPKIKDYFDKVTYKPKYQIGDRVRGFWNNIPFSGAVQLDSLIDEYEGPYIIIYSDLPIKFNDKFFTYIKVTHDQILQGTNKYDINRKTNIKK